MTVVEDFNFEDVVKKALNEAIKERGHVNILIAGKTGVGKSTLINAVFQGNFAITGQGRPVSKETREYKKEGIPLSIFDTRGLEMADFSETLGELEKEVSKRTRSNDSNQHIHVAWVCISEGSRRVERAEEELVKMLEDRNIPVIAVITKANADKGFRTEVIKLLPTVRNAVRVRAIEEELDGGIILPSMGLRDLIDLTMQVVPEGLKRAFTAVQKIDIELKKTKSYTIVGVAATSAGGVAAVPKSFADAVAIVPIQIGMIAGITATFGLSLDESFLATLVGSFITGSGGTVAGRAIVSTLLELIPGVGSIASGTISAGIAATLTTTLGLTYINVLATLFYKNNGKQPTQTQVADAFKKECSQLAIRKK